MTKITNPNTDSLDTITRKLNNRKLSWNPLSPIKRTKNKKINNIINSNRIKTGKRNFTFLIKAQNTNKIMPLLNTDIALQLT